jgi:hypothetical protein
MIAFYVGCAAYLIAVAALIITVARDAKAARRRMRERLGITGAGDGCGPEGLKRKSHSAFVIEGGQHGRS